ncbi:MAG TPA: heterodisulfide reductase-related iron-sulfur binding cluster [Stellaceae bacterium]|nr:heterodisulfide reductase-related iron-sulfur binding cluster [Stellaceae bacterium]
MAEGGLGAPMRHPIAWEDPDFYDAAKIEAELTRVFEICHGCRRCFNLCDSFPRLFDMIDEGPTGEIDGVPKEKYAEVVEACTLCDMCFMTKCPYVPPHEWNVDFPHLMLRHRAAQAKAGKVSWADRNLSETDRNGKLARPIAPLINWAGALGNGLTRPVMEAVAGIDRHAALPKFHTWTFEARALAHAPKVDETAPAFGRKALLYATCFINYNNPQIGEATRAVLAKNGVETQVAYPECCGMPQMEQGDVTRVAGKAKRVAAALLPYVDQGYTIVALVPSCALMVKFEWPLLLPGDPAVQRLAESTMDLSEYVVDIAKKEGLAPGMRAVAGGVSLHLACHARAQNMGAKAAELLRLLPDADVDVIERCSGHGGSWGVKKENFAVAMKVGRPAARQAAQADKAVLSSECPLAALHLQQGVAAAERDNGGTAPEILHPIELMARAYGLLAGDSR